MSERSRMETSESPIDDTLENWIKNHAFTQRDLEIGIDLLKKHDLDLLENKGEKA